MTAPEALILAYLVGFLLAAAWLLSFSEALAETDGVAGATLYLVVAALSWPVSIPLILWAQRP